MWGHSELWQPNLKLVHVLVKANICKKCEKIPSMCSWDIQHKLENSHNHLLCSHILVPSTWMSETGKTITYTDVHHCGRRKNRYQCCREANIRTQILFFVSPSLLLSAPRHITRSWRCNDVLVWGGSSGLIKLLRGQNHLIWLNGPVDTRLRSEMLHYIRTASFTALCSNWAALRSELQNVQDASWQITHFTESLRLSISILLSISFFSNLFLSRVSVEKANIYTAKEQHRCISKEDELVHRKLYHQLIM